MLNNTGWLLSLLWLNLCYHLEPEAPERSSFFMTA